MLQFQLYRPFIPGVHWHEERQKLYIFTKSSVTVIFPWPKPRAWRKTVSQEWYGCRPHIDINQMSLSEKHSHSNSDSLYVQLVLPFPNHKVERKRGETYRQFFETIPTEVRNVLRKFPSRQWHILSLVARVPGALDLVHSNSALAWMLASNWVFRKPSVKQPLRSARALVRHKQRRILKWLGFPEKESAVKILRKIPTRSLDISRLLYLRESMHAPSIIKLLSHIPRLNGSVLRIASDPLLLAYASPKLLQEIGNLRSDDRIPHTAYLLKNLIEMKNLLRSQKTYKFQSIKKLREIHYELTAEIYIHAEEIIWKDDLPSPPLPGTLNIVPLTSVEDLAQEGRTQKNCVLFCSRRIVLGKNYIYKVLAPERATLSIKKRGNLWTLGQLKASCNRSVSIETVEAVREWLDGSKRMTEKSQV